MSLPILAASAAPGWPNTAAGRKATTPWASAGTQALSPPLPNDLVLQAVTSPPKPSDCPEAPQPAPPSPAQVALLQAFARSGGWPNDQEVPIQIQFLGVKVDPTGGPSTAAPFPALDLSTLVFPGSDRQPTVAVVRYDTTTPTTVDVEVGGYDPATGVLRLRKRLDPATGARWWPTGPGGGRYVVALRGGNAGVKTTAGQPIAAQASTLLVAQDKDLTLTENQGLLGASPDPVATATKLEQTRQLYATPILWTFSGGRWVPAPGTGLSALSAIDAVFPHADLASLQTFVVDPSPHVAVDPTAGIVPLPSEFLMAPSYYATPLASKVSVPATGVLAPLAAGLDTLDGFSTTAMILVPLAGAPIAAASVTGSSVVLLAKQGTTWTRVPDFTAAQPTGVYLTVPPPITVDTATGQPCAQPYGSTCVARLIGLQPAAVVPLPEGDARALPPLAEHTQYAVVVTNDVKDVAGTPVAAGTLAKVLTIALNPATPVFSGGTSQLAGVTDASAQQLQALAPLIATELTTDVLPGAAAQGVDPAKIVTAYTFVTQSITAPALQLAQAPAALPPGLQGVSAPVAPDAAARKFGVPTALLRDPQSGQFAVKHFLEAALVTIDLLDPATGALNPAAGAPTPIPVLVALPPDAAVTGGSAPLAVVHHGRGRGRADMLSIAGALAGRGMVVAAIDAAKFGDRSWCRSDADCASGGTCNQAVFGDQKDPANAKPGLCTSSLAHDPVKAGLPACSATVTTDCWDGTGGIARSSGAFFVSQNLFRLRDSMRQDIVDQGALARALSDPANAAALGVTVDPGRVFFVGQSLGAIEGTVDVAVNPIFRRAVLNADGGTFVDIAQDSPAFQAQVAALAAALGLQPNTIGFLQFLQVAKWVIDPADPVNFAASVKDNGALAVLGQAARCDNVVPNEENQLLYGLVGLSPLASTAPAASPSLQWYTASTDGACPADGSTGNGATHGFLFDFANPSLTAKAQASAAAFLLGEPVLSTPVTP